MSYDIQTLIWCGILIVFAVITPLFSAFFRRPKPSAEEPDAASHVPLSIVIAVHEQAKEIARNIPYFFRQQYNAPFEVIVVDDSSTDDTEDVLKQLKNEYPNLYTTFIPETSKYVSRRKLALTLGVKAAKHEWIIFSDADCRPAGEQWLSTIASQLTDDHDLLLGYTRFEDGTPLFWRFQSMLSACYQMRRANNGTAYRHDGHLLAFRKSVFMRHNGFLSNLKYLRGEYDFIVNEYAEKGRTAIEMRSEAHVIRNTPTSQTWLNDNLYYMETRKHLKRSWWNRCLFNTDQLLLHFNYLIDLGTLAYSVYTHHWLLTAVAGLAIVLTVCMRSMMIYRTMTEMHEHIAIWKVPFLELQVVGRNAYYMIRHRLADKYDFIRK